MTTRRTGGVRAQSHSTSTAYKHYREQTISLAHRLVDTLAGEQWDESLTCIANMIPLLTQLLLRKDEA